jgi:hypothetical protein
MDYLDASNDENTEWTLQRGTCSCCGSRYHTDIKQIDDYEPALTQIRLENWERWLWEQLANVYTVRQTHNLGSMVQTYLPTLDLAWNVAMIKARRLGKSWRGRDLPASAIGNQVTAGIMGALEAFEDSLPESQAVRQRAHEDENYDYLSMLFFREQAKEDD